VDIFVSKYENVRAEWKERVGLDSFTQVYRLHFKPEDIYKKRCVESRFTAFCMRFAPHFTRLQGGHG